MVPIHPLTPEQGSARVRSPLVPVPLAKCPSAPAASHHGWFLDEAAAAAAAADPDAWSRASTTPDAAADEAAWKCRGCPSTNPACLVDGPDGNSVCQACGTVASGKMVAGTRQKNCPIEEDRTIIADRPMRDAHEARMEALSRGSETAYERKRRHIAATSGTRVSEGVVKRHGFGKALGQVETQAVRDVRETIEGDSRDARKRRAILTVIEFTFLQEGIDKLDERIKVYIRQEANRIYSAALEHEACCDTEQCQMALTNRSNALVAGCVIQNVLEHLSRTSTVDVAGEAGTEVGRDVPSPVSTMANLHEVASDVPKQTIEKTLAAVRKLNVGNAGSVQRLSALAAIRIVSQWTKPQMCKPCAAREPAPPTVLCRPVSMAATQDQRGGAAAADPGDPCFKLRDRLIGMGRITNARASIQNAALTAISCDRVTQFLMKATIPVDVMAMAMLRATAANLAHEDRTITDPTVVDAIGVCADNNVSDAEYDAFSEELAPILAAAKRAPALDAAFF